MSTGSASTEQHRRESPRRVGVAVITISDTRTLESDRGGAMIVEMLQQAGHEVLRREIVPDEASRLRVLVEECAAQEGVEVVLMTGGTGIAQRDQTFETISQMLTKPLPGYGELFRMLSYDQIGPAAMLSRAIGGVIGQVVVMTMPGSTAAVELAMEKLILPEIAHVVHEARK